MEQDEITRRNVAIAEYMGIYSPPRHVEGELYKVGYYSPDELEFNTDWNQLMLIIEKIMEESSVGFHAFPKFSKNGKHFCRFGMSKNSESTSLIEATWLAVSEYVLALK